MLRYLIYFCIVFSLTISVISDCSSPPAENNFNTTAYIGKWYLIKHSEDTALNNLKCLHQEFNISNDKFILRTVFYNTLIRKYVSFSRALQKTAGNTGSFRFVSPRNGDSHFNIIDTDYMNYCIVWVCHEKASQTVWLIFSRKRKRESEILQNAEDLLPKMKYIYTDQNNC